MSACHFGRSAIHQQHQFIPSHRAKAHTLTEEYLRVITTLLPTLIMHHLSASLPMRQFHALMGFANQNICASISPIQTYAANLTALAVYTYSHVTWMLSHDNSIAFILIEHVFFEAEFACFWAICKTADF